MANILLYAYNVYLNNHYMYTMVIRTLLTVLGGTSVSIEGGGRVEVGENVNIICLCTGDLKCISHPVVFGSVEGITPIHNLVEVSSSTAYDMEDYPCTNKRSY